MNALILAAGRGRRLWPYTSERPKCLLSLGRHTILEHQLQRLAGAGVGRVTIVAGFQIDAVRRQAQATAADLGLSVHVVYNPFFAVSDNLISLWAARSEIGDDMLLLNGDNVFHPHVLDDLLGRRTGPCCLLVHRPAVFGDDDMKVQLDGDRLVGIGKDLPPEQAHAGSLGIMRFRGDGTRLLRAVLEEAVQGEEAMSRFYLDGVQRMADAGCRVRCRDVGDLPWSDIDTPEDLLAVRARVDRFDAALGPLRGRA